MPLDDDYIAQAMQDARKFQGAWTGTAGTLAAHVARLVGERDEHRERLRQMEQELLEIRARLGVPASDAGGLPADVPREFLRDNPHLLPVPAQEAGPLEVDIEPIATSLSPEALEAIWTDTKRRSQSILASCRIEEPAEPVTTAPLGPRLVGIAGRAGAGKTTAAGMIPGAAVVQLADPLYQAVAAMLGLPEAMLRDRAIKDKPLPGIGKSPRQLLQTLGTEWGRETVSATFWVDLARERIGRLFDAGVGTIAIADVRFANEAQMVRDLGGTVWRIVRGTDPVVMDDHASEAGIPAELVDAEIDNAGTLEELRQSVLAAWTLKATN